MSITRINQQRWHCVKLGCCNESPCITWTKCKKGDSEMRSPRILDKSRTALKFVNTDVQKNLSTSDVLDNSDASNKGNEKENSSVSSSNEEDIDSDVSVIK